MTARALRLFVSGSRVRVVETLGFVSVKLPVGSEIWIDDNLPPVVGDEGSENAEVEGWVDIDVAGVTRRSDAIAVVAAAVDYVDPEHEIITGGDIFKMLFCRVDPLEDDDAQG